MPITKELWRISLWFLSSGGFAIVLTVVLLGMKVFGVDIPWLWVFSPVWLPFAAIGVGVLFMIAILALFGLGYLILKY